jgi:parallel beta-helix repeat protein
VKKSIIFPLLIVFLLINVNSCSASAREITVDDNGSDVSFRSIQEAVNNSSSGDLILVLPGIYNEIVDVKTDNLSILSDSGNPEDTVIQGFNLTANNTVVNGFSIEENVTLRGSIITGVGVEFIPENCTVKNNIFLENSSGVIINNCFNSTIEKNLFLGSGTGIAGSECNNCIFSENKLYNSDIYLNSGGSETNVTIINNTLLGCQIGIGYCSKNRIINNTIDCSGISLSEISPSGISLSESYENIIDRNSVSNCSYGISASFIASGNQIINNTLISNTKGIIVTHYSSGNIIKNNTISNNNIGILLDDPAMVTDNRIELNEECGIYLDLSSDDLIFTGTSLIYNNLFNKTEIEDFRYSLDGALWNTTKVSERNIEGGPYMGGNYWARPDGTGFSETCMDLDGDWICDSLYNINGNEVDYLPLSSFPSYMKNQ